MIYPVTYSTTTILVIIILKIYNVLLQVGFSISKTKFDIKHKKLFDLPHRLPNGLICKHLRKIVNIRKI